MPQAISLHLGLNAVDANVYRGWSGPLRGCENDARAMQAITAAQGFTSRLLLGADATRTNLLAAMKRKRPCHSVCISFTLPASASSCSARGGRR